MPSLALSSEVGQLAADLAVLAEPHRLLVLGELRGGPRSAGALARATNMAPSLASHHLAVLLKADLVSRWREGSFVYYTLNHRRAGDIQQALARLTKPTGGARSARSRGHSENGERAARTTPESQAG
ncbi:MAG: ArsR/SmtB family transcription factor [Acidimicrobiia bacterium]